MLYTYELHIGRVEALGLRRHVTTELEDLEREIETLPSSTDFFVKVYSNKHPDQVCMYLDSLEWLEEWRNSQERACAWKPFDEKETGIHVKEQIKKDAGKLATFSETVEKAVNPSHYEAYIEDLQWIDAKSRQPNFRGENSERFLGALELQVSKYLDRLGRKDASIQELKKARWYLTYMIAFMENDCKPIKVKDVKGLY